MNEKRDGAGPWVLPVVYMYIERESFSFFLLPFFLPGWTGTMNVVITIPSEQWDEKAVDVL